MAVTLQVQLLGEFRLLYNHQPVSAVSTARIQMLLAYLLIHRAAPQARQQLAYLFWPDSSDSQARTNLRNAIFQLRNALPDANEFLQVESQTIQWRPDVPCQLDIGDFEVALAAADAATDAAVKVAALGRAIEAYGGELLPGVYDDWLIQERERLRQRFLFALDALTALLEAQQEYRPAIETAQRLLQADPLRETTYAKLMQLHAHAGDRAAALRVYHTCTTTLARELGVDPDPMTRRVYEHLLNLDSPPPALSRLHDASPLVGRDKEWTQLQQAWHQAARGHPGFVLVQGEAGIGKTRLVEELVEWAHRQGIAAATAHCYAFGGNLAFAPVQEWLRAPVLRRARQQLAPMWADQVTRLLPELLNERTDLVQPTTPVESWQRQQLFTALARLLLFGGEPLLLVLDDVQWCDQDTVEWIQHLLSTNANARLLIVGTQRREALSSQHVLKPLLQHLSRTGNLIELELTRLSASETGALAANLLGEPLHADQRAVIYAETEGNPLFVVETVRAGQGSRATSGRV